MDSQNDVGREARRGDDAMGEPEEQRLEGLVTSVVFRLVEVREPAVCGEVRGSHDTATNGSAQQQCGKRRGLRILDERDVVAAAPLALDGGEMDLRVIACVDNEGPW